MVQLYKISWIGVYTAGGYTGGPVIKASITRPPRPLALKEPQGACDDVLWRFREGSSILNAIVYDEFVTGFILLSSEVLRTAYSSLHLWFTSSAHGWLGFLQKPTVQAYHNINIKLNSIL